MNSHGGGAGLASLLEADLRALSAESRKQESGFAGYFGGASFPEIKEAAERALLKMRSLPQQGQMPLSKTLATVDVRPSSHTPSHCYNSHALHLSARFNLLDSPLTVHLRRAASRVERGVCPLGDG
jgi:hypothetical protein